MKVEQLKNILVQCGLEINSLICSLIINDYFGGKIIKCLSSSGIHYYNLIDGQIINLFMNEYQYENFEEISREELLIDDNIKKEYIDFLYNLKQLIRISEGKKFKLIDSFGKEYLSSVPGMFGGNKKLKIYGRLDCPSANRWISKGHYVSNRVFFLNEDDAIGAGYRPCAVCMPEEYKRWKNSCEENYVLKL